jgi:hypothetical protein
MADVLTPEVDAKLEQVNVGAMFFFLIELQSMNNIRQFCEKPKIRTWRAVEI